MKGEKSNSHIRKWFSLSQCLNPSPSAVNPIFKVQKKANTSSHFTPLGSSIRCLNRMLEVLTKQLETEGYVVKTTKWSISYRAESHYKNAMTSYNIDRHLTLKYVHIW